MDPLALVVILVLAALVVGGLARAYARSRARRLAAPPAPSAAPGGEGLGAKVRAILRGRPGDEEWARLEESLVRADVGPRAARALVERVRGRYEEGADPAALLAEEVAAAFAGDPALDLRGAPSVVMVVGVNGSGKTTTIGKLAHRLRTEGRAVGLAACDTYRAAAVPQLAAWSERTGAQLLGQARGADPGAVAFDAVAAAQARGIDVLIVDTAGRLHTREPLMRELAKVRRVLERAAGSVDEVLLVVDATTGQNGIAQAREFGQRVGVTGVALAKLDGTARGGIVLAIREELGLPVKLLGTGEGVNDLRPFDAEGFARALVGK